MEIQFDFYCLAGLGIVLLSLTCLSLNAIVLSVIYQSKSLRIHTAYKFMLMMGIFDVLQGMSHFATGVFTLLRYDAEHWVYQVLATMISPGYETYIFVTILLAFHRFVLFCWWEQEKTLFYGSRVKIWYVLTALVFLAYTGVQLSGKVYTFYVVEDLGWTYDYSLPWTATRTEFVFYYQIVGIFIAWLLYLTIAVKLVRFKSDVASAAKYRANRVILVQALIITLWCTIQNFLWHKLQLFTGPNIIINYVLNMMWIGNSGLSMFLCVLMNRQVRRRIVHAFMNSACW
ncbi:hypothetical protein QR680_010161 [Steinernema hermaphroditum]|uniref:Uncharacterized protein n=1 Tax=Steinernema hermaphroditum TaxID=289476 RepID=A0AA39MAQ7_9BILA|nr:hypothetical protein QR680_010161 [Steinernema hermaphroditum]